ncbi:MAG: P-loop NTPase [Nitrospinaceae bacterium]|jgi:flagellar biosynthesis protein FlhG|tara:strand:+ start:111 stop:1085 length:975 start_codon:yes stop_codon:yes gene_type:complete
MASSINIIPVGGGKGGIGKSIISTNLAVGIALSGQKVVLMDGDFGASNLHALLGISHPIHGFQDLFINNKSPESLLIETGISNLKFISSAGDNPGSANIDTEHVKKIISFIKKLNADTVILDLGPGTSFNILDFFNISAQSIVMSSPEITSVMKTFSFIRSALFRRISLHLKDLPNLQKLVDHSKYLKTDLKTYSVDTLRKNISNIDDSQTKEINQIIEKFKPSIIINRVRSKKDLLAGNNMVNLVKKYLDVNLNYIGYIVESDRVRDSVEDMVPFLIKDPQSKPSQNLQQIIGTLTNTDLHLVKEDGRIFVSKQVRLNSGWDA